MRKILFTIFIVFLGVGVWAQKSDGTTKSLVLTEKAFAEDVAKNGTKAAFNKFTASDGVVFKPIRSMPRNILKLLRMLKI
jgi:hypothetical protein